MTPDIDALLQEHIKCLEWQLQYCDDVESNYNVDASSDRDLCQERLQNAKDLLHGS